MLVSAPGIHAQLFTDAIGIAESRTQIIPKSDGHFMLRHFLLSANHDNTQHWRVENIEQNINTFKKQPIIMTPGFHHIVSEDYDEWIKIQKPYAIGSIEDIIYDPVAGVYDAISDITDTEVEKQLSLGVIPKFVSPAIHGTYREENGVQVFYNWRGVHSAIVIHPAFRPTSIAEIHKTACKGDQYICKMKLAAIAEDLSKVGLEHFDNGILLKNNYDAYIAEMEKNNRYNNMSAINQDGNAAYKELVQKFQSEADESRKKVDILSEKLKAEMEARTEAQNTLKKITEERDDFKGKVSTWQANEKRQETKKQMDEKLKRVKGFHDDAEKRQKKVDELVEKNIPIDSIDSIYETMMLSDEDFKKLEEEKLTNTNNQININPPSSSGVASDVHTTLNTNKQNNKKLQGVLLMDAIMGVRL